VLDRRLAEAEDDRRRERGDGRDPERELGGEEGVRLGGGSRCGEGADQGQHEAEREDPRRPELRSRSRTGLLRTRVF